ncbi:MAG: glycosyltransferase family 1 protein [bacterium]
MQIAIDIRHLTAPNPSGVGHYTIRLIEEMASASRDDAFILFASGRPRTLANLPKFDAPNIQVVTRAIPNRVLYALLRLPGGPALEDFLSVKPDMWFFPNLNITRTRLPYALAIHDLSFKIFPKFFTLKDRAWYRTARTERFIESANRLLAVSGSTKQDLVNLLKIDPSKIAVTHLGVDEIYCPDEQPSDKNYLNAHDIGFPYILTLSTLEPRKNIESVVEAYSSWRNQLSTDYCLLSTSRVPHLVIAGGRGWRSRSITDVIKRSKFQRDIHLIGYVPDRHKPALYRHADLLVFPSFYEGFGLPPLEALACGTQVITSFTGSMPEVVGNAAVMIDPYDVADLELAFDQMLNVGVTFRSPARADSLKAVPTSNAHSRQTCGIEQANKFQWYLTAQKTLAALKTLGVS